MGNLLQLEAGQAYETLIETPEKFNEVCALLLEFINNNTSDLGIYVKTMEELRDGAVLVIMAGIVGNFFVPFSQYYLKPSSDENNLANVTLALKLLGNMGILVDTLPAQEILDGDTKTISRAM